MLTVAMKQTEVIRPANPERIHHSLLASLEKRCLIWFAMRMPAQINSDHLTVLGFLGMLFCGLSYWWSATNRWGLIAASLFLAVNWFGDSLDGTLARVRNRQRPLYGFYVDHIVDTFGALFLLVGMSLSGLMNPWIAAGVLIAYYVLSIEIYLAAVATGKFRLSFWKFGPTELRLALLLGNITALIVPHARRLFDAGGVVAIALLAVITLASVVRNTRVLYQTESVRER